MNFEQSIAINPRAWQPGEGHETYLKRQRRGENERKLQEFNATPPSNWRQLVSPVRIKDLQTYWAGGAVTFIEMTRALLIAGVPEIEQAEYCPWLNPAMPQAAPPQAKLAIDLDQAEIIHQLLDGGTINAAAAKRLYIEKCGILEKYLTPGCMWLRLRKKVTAAQSARDYLLTYAEKHVKIFLLNPDHDASKCAKLLGNLCHAKSPLGSHSSTYHLYAEIRKICGLVGDEKYSHKTATCDPNIINQLFDLCEKYKIAPGVGIPCQQNRIVCFDCDTHTPGIDGVANFHAHMKGENLEDAAVQKSANGGVHYIWKTESADLTFPKILCPGVDVKWAGYFCAEPTTIHGKPYKWEAGKNLLEILK